ncbi:hypothetical protein V1512DRAFT_222575 [Lipomyces arxii]|uniref:uncharacterized protein n=1 Tax=Lipomyces arxii TaxID=56418 RepID=UPI0034CDD19B
MSDLAEGGLDTNNEGYDDSEDGFGRRQDDSIKLTFGNYYGADDSGLNRTAEDVPASPGIQFEDSEENVWASSARESAPPHMPDPVRLSSEHANEHRVALTPEFEDTPASTKFTEVVNQHANTSLSSPFTNVSPTTPPKTSVFPKVEDYSDLSDPEDANLPVSPTHQHRNSNELGEVEKSFFTDPAASPSTDHRRQMSEWSHQQIASPMTHVPSSGTEGHQSASTGSSTKVALEHQATDGVPLPPPDVADDEWHEMPAFASHDIYDDDGKIVAHEMPPSEDEEEENQRRGGAGKGYTRVTLDEADAEHQGYIDTNTKYLFKDDDPTNTEARDPRYQLRTTKDLLTDTQRIAYVGLCKLAMVDMATELAQKRGSTKIARIMSSAYGSMAMWSQKIIMRLYAHMDISPEEQLMIEQLSSHGVETMDLTPVLMINARVRNPLSSGEEVVGPAHADTDDEDDKSESPLPEYSATDSQLNGDVKNPDEIQDTKTLDIDVRWTVLCDLFLVLVADSIYDSRSRTLLEEVGKTLQVDWLDISKFEKRVTDALDIEEGVQQNWKEDEIIEHRRKLALKKKYMYMGLATLGGGLVIGLSAGLLAPVIGAGLAAGLTTIGIAGTGGFLAGAGGAAIVTTTGVAIGAQIGNRGMSRRMGHVKTFEFRPLHNNERVNLILTISGWLSGKEDDVRLPFSTVDPIMGDIFSLYWEPDMLQSMGQTINLLATEVITQSIQQVLGSTVLVALMASLQWPMILAKLSYLLDNPWSVSLDRAWAAGLILADTLIQRNLGVRPVTLVGFSLGARVIVSCLIELAKRRAFGLVQNVYLFGSPVVVKRDQFVMASSMVSGRFVNGYSRRDWVLGYLFRATSGGLMRIAGLAAIEGVNGIENYDCTEFVDGHMGYREAMPKLLRHCGWEVLSDEFTEIEDPDPDYQRDQQRELVLEFEEAKRRMEKEQAKAHKRGFLSKWLKPKKKEWWEMVQEDAQDMQSRSSQPYADRTYDSQLSSRSDSVASDSNRVSDDGYTPPPDIVRGAGTGVGPQAGSSSGPGYRAGQTQHPYAFNGESDTLFDVDAIRREIARANRQIHKK